VWLTGRVALSVPVSPVRRPAVPAVGLLVASMLSVQVGGALSVGVFDEVGPAGTAWLRLCCAGLVLLVLVRPRVSRIAPAHRRTAAQLGAASALMTITYFEAISRLPLGTASALEFLGPLGVAVAGARGRFGLVVPAVAAAGVLALTEPWAGDADAIGVAMALVAAGGWAAYIVLTQRVGDALDGLTGLALSIPVAAVCATPLGLADAAGNLGWQPIAQAAGLAILLPLLPYALELVALRRLHAAAFGTLMCLEPALGVVVGLVLLGQHPRVLGVLGVALVIGAGIAANRAGRRPDPDEAAGAPRALGLSEPPGLLSTAGQ
jgi:inner membrane transporter RhtA